MSVQTTQDAPEVKRPLEDANAYVDMTGEDFGVPAEEMPEEQAMDETVPQEQPEEQPSKEEDWEHKYRVLKGKYDKEVPRLHRKIKQLEKDKEQLIKRLELLEQLLSTQTMQMQTQSPQAPQQGTSIVAEEDEDLKKLKDEYPELYRALNKMLSNIAKQFESKISETTTKLTQQQFEAQLTALVPEWRILNSDPSFISWLQEIDPNTGLTKHQLLLMAYERRDANAVAKFFRKYLQERDISFNEEPMNTSNNTAPARKNVAPPHRRTSSSVRETSKKLFKESEIREFYRLCALGRISPEQKAKMEQEIVNAIIENRVILGK